MDGEESPNVKKTRHSEEQIIGVLKQIRPKGPRVGAETGGFAQFSRRALGVSGSRPESFLPTKPAVLRFLTSAPTAVAVAGKPAGQKSWRACSLWDRHPPAEGRCM